MSPRLRDGAAAAPDAGGRALRSSGRARPCLAPSAQLPSTTGSVAPASVPLAEAIRPRFDASPISGPLPAANPMELRFVPASLLLLGAVAAQNPILPVPTPAPQKPAAPAAQDPDKPKATP